SPDSPAGPDGNGGGNGHGAGGPAPNGPRFRLLATVLSGLGGTTGTTGAGFGELSRVVSTSPDALADVRVVPHGDSVRAFWTAPDPATGPDLTALGRAYLARLEQLADDPRAWWSGDDAGPAETALPWVPSPDR
ncbi:MAG TPA: hypothetical protein VMU51_19415, partial [Mycobacteriales bacterium]|nr:hypothetical protein [Mycobacteriales bacterium]